VSEMSSRGGRHNRWIGPSAADLMWSMEGYEPVRSFDEATAAEYDALVVRGDEDATVAFLHDLAQGGPALELAIGTGRIALPLSATGVRVDGIDFSEAMVARLRSKAGGADLTVIIGDFCDVAVDGLYALIYVVFNSLFNVLSQEDQVRCFENVASRLVPGGAFVVEGGCTLGWLDRVRLGQYVEAERIDVEAVRFDLLRLDPATQTLYENHVQVTRSGARFTPVVQRYAWPSELDLMARIAGLRLEQRWGGWNREQFTARSENVISVYRA
jgi:SAM-dependent methyltransferase